MRPANRFGDAVQKWLCADEVNVWMFGTSKSPEFIRLAVEAHDRAYRRRGPNYKVLFVLVVT